MVFTRRGNDKKPSYNIGDTVEVLLTDGVEVGVLQSKIGDDGMDDMDMDMDTATQHWVVAIGDEEMDLSEKYLGRLVDPAAAVVTTTDSDNSVAESAAPTNNNNLRKKKRRGAPHTRKKPATKHSRTNSSSTSKQQQQQQQSYHAASHTRAVTRSKGSDSELYKGIETIPVIKKQPGPSRAVDKNCTKVKMLTGTLYLYKNPRRAEFVAMK